MHKGKVIVFNKKIKKKNSMKIRDITIFILETWTYLWWASLSVVHASSQENELVQLQTSYLISIWRSSQLSIKEHHNLQSSVEHEWESLSCLQG